jgi:hypothetical protein
MAPLPCGDGQEEPSIRKLLDIKLRNSPMAIKVSCGAVKFPSAYDIRRERV